MYCRIFSKPANNVDEAVQQFVTHGRELANKCAEADRGYIYTVLVPRVRKELFELVSGHLILRDADIRFRLWHPDDVAELIVNWGLATLQSKPFDAEHFCQRHHEHWGYMDGDVQLLKASFLRLPPGAKERKNPA